MTGPAWDRLLASTRSDDRGAALLRPAYEAGQQDALCIPLDAPAYDPRRMQAAALAMGEKRGAWGRGSRARYRRAVTTQLRRWEHNARIAATMAAGMDGTSMVLLRTMHERQARHYGNAARRARAILARLDQERG